MDKERYRRGSHTVADLKYHFVWSTRYGSRVLRDDAAPGLRDIIREIRTEKELEVVKGSIRPDHVHILIGAPAHYSPAKIAQYLKGKSSYRLQRELPDIRKRYWGRRLNAVESRSFLPQQMRISNIEQGIANAEGSRTCNQDAAFADGPAKSGVGKTLHNSLFLVRYSIFSLREKVASVNSTALGRRPWGRGYFCSTVGAVPEEQIKQYIANQSDETGRIEGADESPGADDAEPDFDPDLRG